MNRRLFVSSLAAATALRALSHVPVRKAKVTKLFKSPDGYPNALEATPEGLWVGEQVTDIAYLLDWKTGEVLKKVPTESSNTSGMAYGGGYLWMGANGAPALRLARPGELKTRRIVKVDPDDGRTMGIFDIPDGSGAHGLAWGDNALWLICFKWNTIAKVDPVSFKVLHQIPLQLPGPHGIAWDPPGLWVLYQGAYLIMKQDVTDGHVTDIIALKKGEDPVPHGMDIYQGKLYYCDAGLRGTAEGDMPDNSESRGYICRVDVQA